MLAGAEDIQNPAPACPCLRCASRRCMACLKTLEQIGVGRHENRSHRPSANPVDKTPARARHAAWLLHGTQGHVVWDRHFGRPGWDERALQGCCIETVSLKAPP